MTKDYRPARPAATSYRGAGTQSNWSAHLPVADSSLPAADNAGNHLTTATPQAPMHRASLPSAVFRGCSDRVTAGSLPVRAY